MLDVENAVASELTQLVCETCGERFDRKSRLERHLATAHPDEQLSEADVEKVLVGVSYPIKKRRSWSPKASKNISDRDLLDVIKSFPDTSFRNSVDIARALRQAKQAKKARAA